jgi:Ca2+/Na+ antiporter
MYIGLMKWQLYLLVLIAVISLFPLVEQWPKWIEQVKQVTLIVSLLVVLLLMIIQYSKNYMEGWQKSRFLAESILSNTWLLFFKHEKYDLPFNEAIETFHKRIKEMKDEIDVKQFLSFAEKPNKDHDVPIWVKENFDVSMSDKKEFYLKYRLRDQINWYYKKASYNKQNSTYYFIGALIAMGIGLVLTIFVMINWIPNLSYLSFFTTVAASIFSWKQTKRFDELKTTYSVSSDELDDFKKTLLLDKAEDEVKEIIFDTEKAISREHKLWFSKIFE